MEVVLTHILVAGLPLKVRARLQGCLNDVQVEAARDAQELLERLSKESFAAVVVNETILEAPVIDFLAKIARVFHGIIIFCAAGQHSANDLRLMVQRHHVAVILQHPIDPAELLRSLVVQLGLQMRVMGTRNTHSEEVLLDQVWAENQNVFDDRLTVLRRIVETPTDKAKLEEAWRAAHLMCGTLGSFGLDRGTLLLREVESLLTSALDGQPLNIDRITRVVGALRAIVEAHRSTQTVVWADSVLLVICDDEELLHQLELEAMLLHWTIEVCEDLSTLSQMLGELEARAVLLDMAAHACSENPELVQELLSDSIPCVVLCDEPQESGVPHLVYISRNAPGYLGGPSLPYDLMMAVLRTQVTPAPEKPSGILVVDDDKIILKVISNMLSKIDLYVQTLNCPLEFWDTLEQMKPDLVVLDVDLPPLGGIELCRALRADPRYAALPVMFLSSYNDAETLQKCYEAGADDYLYKPVSGLELTTRITNRLERTRQIAARPLPAQQTVHPFSSLDQMLLRALRDEAPACLVRIEVRTTGDEFESQALLNRLQRLLRKSLRGEDVVKPLGPLELLVGMSGVDRRFARKRLETILHLDLQTIRLGYAQFPQEGTDLGALIDQARPPREEAGSVALSTP